MVELAKETHLGRVRRLIEEQYRDHPTGCGASFDELLCYELHSGGLTFCWLAEKWGISLPTLGELIWDHCKLLEREPRVDHQFEPQRQSCKACGRRDHFDFHVPDDVWAAVVPMELRNLVVCLSCFDRFAREAHHDYSKAVRTLLFVGDRATFEFSAIRAVDHGVT